MPVVSFSSENRAPVSGPTFPVLKLKFEEKARIVLLEPEPHYEYVHLLRAPALDEHDQPIMETRDRRDGSKFTDYRLDFVGLDQCLGDYGVIQDKGVDAQNCPACEASLRSSGEVPPPARRFAVHVFRYYTRPGSFALASGPFRGEVLVWRFTETMFNKLVDFHEEHGNLVDLDFMLRCISQTFQNYDIQPAAGAEWRKSNDRKQVLKDLYQAALAEPHKLADFCGMKRDRSRVETDVSVVIDRYRQAKGGTVKTEPDDQRSLEEFAHAALGTRSGAESGPWSTPIRVAASASGPSGQMDLETALSLDAPANQAPGNPGGGASKEGSDAGSAPLPDPGANFAEIVRGGDEAQARPAKPGESGETLDFDALLGLENDDD